ncbi:hypothetical protein ZIOFF_060247 [Zingiber officinale]|uniref:Protein NEDD1 n=1 Tax=Zingiber officinale TaxID=94328 RepID=A0A8J5FAH1_ZINOF|nr:hypothetical protein ZIOFF_060247 [Zingiber officinale]
MQFVDSSVSLLATCGGDTVKLFDVTVDAGDPCTLSYTPSPGSQINSVKWNHTNLVVASAGDDKKISLWNKNGQSMGSFPSHGSDLADDIEIMLIQLFMFLEQCLMMDCKHIYEKKPIIHYISTKKPHPRCPVAGCPKILQVGRVVCDALLTIEIDEMHLASATNIHSTMVEDFTEVD